MRTFLAMSHNADFTMRSPSLRPKRKRDSVTHPRRPFTPKTIHIPLNTTNPLSSPQTPLFLALSIDHVRIPLRPPRPLDRPLHTYPSPPRHHQKPRAARLARPPRPLFRAHYLRPRPRRITSPLDIRGEEPRSATYETRAAGGLYQDSGWNCGGSGGFG